MTVPSTVHFVSWSYGDEFAARYPIVTNAIEGVILPIAAFIHYRLTNNASEQSLEADAYCLAEFFDYLSSINIIYYMISVPVLKGYLDLGAKRTSNVTYLRAGDSPISYKATLKRKRGIIYNFYRVLQEKLNLIKGVLQPSASKDPAGYRLPSAPVQVGIGVPRAGDDNNFTRHKAREAKERRRRPRPTPSPEEAEVVINRLLERRDQNRASTYYLAASLEILGGARGCGVNDLTVSSLTDALLEEPEVSALVKPISPKLNAVGPAGLANTRHGMAIVRGLKSMATAGRRFIFVMVIEKGKARPLPVTIALALEILDYIWSERGDFICRKQARDPMYSPPDNVFLSYKTGLGLQASTFSQVISKVLRDNGIPGTAHRLRATFAEQVVRDLYYKDRNNNGGNPDFMSIIQLAYEILGHSNHKTIRKYINNIVKRDTLLKGHVVLVNDYDDSKLLKKVATALETERGSEIRRCLIDILAAA